ncbi:hypothetical protein [Bradyrhizobium sp. 17]|uniref:hypothetical protein n=1 Tax=Bradyrhizobium sp. 17 TaxID=2782649 RepID=UPI001FF73802|nr:hypothetical protein [Bradyrhizobium sp. 17]MCK1518794.1 hypothetical protein [Bradyrhizobium sp. 17]
MAVIQGRMEQHGKVLDASCKKLSRTWLPYDVVKLRHRRAGDVVSSVAGSHFSNVGPRMAEILHLEWNSDVFIDERKSIENHMIVANVILINRDEGASGLDSRAREKVFLLNSIAESRG